MLAQRRYEDARRLAVESRGILSESLPEDSWQVAAAMNVEGAALAGTGQFKDAEQLLLASRAALGQAPIPDLAEKGRLRLLQLYTEWGKPDEANKYRSGS